MPKKEKCLFVVRPNKKVAVFPEIGRVKMFRLLPIRIVECVSEYIFFVSNEKKTQTYSKSN